MWPQNNKWKDRAKKKQRKGGRNFVRAKSPWQDRGARQREGKPGTRHTPAGKAWQWTVALHLRKEKSQHGLFWVGHLVLHCADYERPRLPGGGWAAGSVVPKGFKVTTVGEVARGRHLGNDQSPHSPPGLLLFPGPWLRFKGYFEAAILFMAAVQPLGGPKYWSHRRSPPGVRSGVRPGHLQERTYQ